MTWNCAQIEARLSDYLDQLLDGEERQAFSAHAAVCAQCSRLVEQVGGWVAQIRRLEPVEAPPRLASNILDQTLGPRKAKATGETWLGRLRWAFQPRFAMGLVTVALSVAIVSQALGIEWSGVSVTDLTPANIYRAADRRVHLIYARGVKFVNDLRVVYEIQSRLQRQPEAPPPRPTAPGSTEAAPENKREQDLNRTPITLAWAIAGGSRRSL